MKERLAATLKKAGINATAVCVLGRFVHIDTFEKYSLKLQNLLIEAGFQILMAKGGMHMDGFKGFRISAKVK